MFQTRITSTNNKKKNKNLLSTKRFVTREEENKPNKQYINKLKKFIHNVLFIFLFCFPDLDWTWPWILGFRVCTMYRELVYGNLFAIFFFILFSLQCEFCVCSRAKQKHQYLTHWRMTLQLFITFVVFEQREKLNILENNESCKFDY